MGFICKIKDNKYLDNPIDRDLGLSNIYNINSKTNFCFESFNGPSYYVSGATKPLTGNTSPCSGSPTNCYSVYNFSEVDEVNLDFNFTGSTDYTGYTGSFCYNIYNRKNFTLETPNKTLNQTPSDYSKCINFSAITSSTINEIISLGNLPFTNTDYMLRSYYKFIPKECIKKEINTWTSGNQLNKFDFDFDWYFITVTDPQKPKIVDTNEELIDSVTLVQERINGARFQNYFELSNQPIGNKINLYVNGVRLSYGLDFTLDTSLFPRTNPVVNIFSGDIESTDIITVVYLVGPESYQTALGLAKNDLFEIDTFQVSGFTTNVTASTVNIVNNNTVKGTQEVFLTNNYDYNSSIVAVVNGVTLFENLEYYKSTTTPNKIILNPNNMVIKEGDILSFWYFKTKFNEDNDLGTLNKNSIRLQWKTEPIREQLYNTGKFVVEVTEKSDTNWINLFYTTTINYSNNTTIYESNVTNLEVNKDYKFRIIFNKTYKNILKEDIITSSEVIGYFNTKNDKIIYSY